MRTRSILLTSLAAGLLMACSTGTPTPTGGTPTPTGAGGSVAPGSQPATSSAPLPTGLSVSIPPFSFAIPSFAPDPTLEAAFPSTIDGQPVSVGQSASFLAVLQAFETDQAKIDAFVASMRALGVDPAAVSFADGSVTLDGEDVTIQALRTPGGSAASAIQGLIALDPPEVPPTITTETIGGKSATVATLDDGSEELYYASGEFAWFLDSVDRAQAEVIFAALP